MSGNILQTKLYMPRIRPSLVPRPHLITKLNGGLHRKLTLLSAPAGFGKTTLVSEWIAGCDQPFAWLSLDKSDSDLIHFLTYLIAALQTHRSSLGHKAAGMLALPQPPPAESILTTLINEIVTVQDEFALVLDDYDVLNAPLIDRAVDFLLQHLPKQMHLVITTRQDPNLSLSQLRARGLLTELRTADLRFTVEETAVFLQKVTGLTFSAHEIAVLERRTEGWIAGLQLAAVSMRGQNDVHEFIETFAGDARYIADYLVDEVLQHQPEHIRSFLIQTSILERLSGSLCDAVTNQSEGELLLERLELSNLFITPLDNKRQWYRYHRLFAEMLQTRLKNEVERASVAALHERASVWFEANGFLSEAIEHALATPNYERAARLVEQIADQAMYRTGEAAALARWLNELPDSVAIARPGLLLIQGWMALWMTRPDAVDECLDALPRDSLPTNLMGQVATLRAQVAGQRGDVEETISHAASALTLLGAEERRLRGLALSALGNAYRDKGQVRLAAEVFQEAAAVFQAAELIIPSLIALTRQGQLLQLQGQLPQALTIYEQAIHLASDHQAGQLPAAGGLYIGLGELYWEWHDLAQAARMVQKGIVLCRQWSGFADETIMGLLTLAGIRQTRGEYGKGLDAVREAQAVVDTFQMSSWQPLVKMQRAHILLAQGNLAAAKAQLPDELEHLPRLQQERRQIALARLRLAQGRPDTALALLIPWMASAELEGRIAPLIEMLVIGALAYRQQTLLQKALTLLQQAVEMAEPSGFIRPFISKDETMLSLLHQLARRATGHTLTYIGQLLAASQIQPPPPPPPGVEPLREPLTERQLEVLQLMAAGLSNQEIAETLVIAVSTVKRHINHLYGKLAVKNRLQAVERARALQLF